MDRQVYARVTAEEYAALEQHADENERSLAAELRLAVRAWLARIEQNDTKAAA